MAWLPLYTSMVPIYQVPNCQATFVGCQHLTIRRRSVGWREGKKAAAGGTGYFLMVRLEVGSLRTVASGQGQHAGLCLGSQGTREGWVPDRSLTGLLKNQSDINWFRSYWVGQSLPTLSLYFLLDIGWS